MISNFFLRKHQILSLQHSYKKETFGYCVDRASFYIHYSLCLEQYFKTFHMLKEILFSVIVPKKYEIVIEEAKIFLEIPKCIHVGGVRRSREKCL